MILVEPGVDLLDGKQPAVEGAHHARVAQIIVVDSIEPGSELDPVFVTMNLSLDAYLRLPATRAYSAFSSISSSWNRSATSAMSRAILLLCT